jgi:hypothetical protein
MPLRPRPGRSGQIWLARQLEKAQRASELNEQRRLAPEEETAASEWERAARSTERWTERATLLGGQRQLHVVQHALASSDGSYGSALAGFSSVAQLAQPRLPGAAESARADRAELRLG